MASIVFDQVCVDFPIYNASARSLKKRLFQVATGGQIGADTNGRVVVRALENLSFSLKDGDRVALLGHNGAGKSTLLRLLSGVYEPSSGRALVKGEIGSLIDIGFGIDAESSGRENIYLRGALLGLTRAEITKKLDEIIEFSELGDFIDMPTRTYSAGMHLRLAFSVSTVIRPEILLMDEWLSVGDEGFKVRAEKRLNELVESTRILVIATHSRALVAHTCNRAIWLEHGRVKMDGAPDEVTSAYFGPPQTE
ncbi:ABC transporter ATP-binding protein [Achromobacter denitrificans]|uniref:ABC transporter ATP-binding protein n=1 Tax=Achromobacter TaxID=222 RepID=UPI00240E2061|nr:MULTISPECIES: ABC transporter ATP-binding protein [Achromobacter]WFC68450.1 ABC transporter ATP-binding protein [Achromobacter denitrificans]BEG76744.1 Teichoic acids export ATP-binding protein TagH [Achromobacter xylosoxidans]